MMTVVDLKEFSPDLEIKARFDKERNCLIVECLQIGKNLIVIKSDSCRPKYLGCDGVVYDSPSQYFNKFININDSKIVKLDLKEIK